MDGLHSPFGFMWAIQKETGWSDQEILWRQSMLSLRLKMADAPRYVKGERTITVDNLEDI